MTLLLTLAAFAGVAAFTGICWLVAEALMRLCGKDPAA
jgi:hypothetical protein